MNWADYFAHETQPNPHEIVFESDTKIMCNYVYCSYEETFPNYEDAQIAAEIHMGAVLE